MKPSDSKLILLTIKIIGLLFLVFIFIVNFPQHAHLVILLIAFILLFIGYRALAKYNQQNNWLESQGAIESVSEKEEYVAISQYSKMKYFYPEIEYKYNLNDISYIGNAVSFEKENIWVPEVNNWGDPASDKDRWWLSLHKGDKIPVYVNPKDNNEAVLINNVSKKRRSHHLALLVSGILLSFIWLILAIQT